MTEPEPKTEAGAGTSRVEVQNVRRERTLSRARVVASLVAMVAAPWALGALGFPTLAVLGGLGALLAYFWSAVSLAGTDRGPGERRLVPGRAVIAGDRLVVTADDTTTSLPLSQIEGGWTERAGDAHRAVLSFTDGRVVAVELPSEEQASALLVEAGVSPSARAVRMRGYREDAGGRKIAGFFLAFFGLLLSPVVVAVPALLFAALRSWSVGPLGILASMLVGVVPLAAICRWLWRKVRPTWIQIGADGVVLQGAFRKRFFRHDAILRARITTSMAVAIDRSVELTLKGGETYDFPVASEAEARAVCDRIQAARTATGEQDRARLLDVLARSGRPVPEWKRALESLVQGQTSGYRSAGHDLDTILRIVEDVAAPLEQRIAAALAARPQGGDEAQKRIRIAAEACVEPRVRIALERASSGDLSNASLEEIGSASAESAPERAGAAD